MYKKRGSPTRKLIICIFISVKRKCHFFDFIQVIVKEYSLNALNLKLFGTVIGRVDGKNVSSNVHKTLRPI